MLELATRKQNLDQIRFIESAAAGTRPVDVLAKRLILALIDAPQSQQQVSWFANKMQHLTAPTTSQRTSGEWIKSNARITRGKDATHRFITAARRPLVAAGYAVGDACPHRLADRAGILAAIPER